MRVIQVTATAGADGRLRLDIPTGFAGATFDVAVVPQTTPTPEGNEHRSKTTESLASLFGCIADDSFVAPRRGMPSDVRALVSI